MISIKNMKGKYDKVRRLPSSGRIPLRDRLEAAGKGEPADSAYAACMAKLLDGLLAASVESDLEEFLAMGMFLEKLPDGDYSPTYGSTLELVRDLTHRYLDSGDSGEYMLAGELMSMLLSWLADGPKYVPESGEGPRSLQARLGDIQGTPVRTRIAGATVTGYMRGAVARLGTECPRDINELEQGGVTTVEELARFLKKQWFRETPSGRCDGRICISGTFTDMYSLLVHPILPDGDTLRSMREQRTA